MALDQLSEVFRDSQFEGFEIDIKRPIAIRLHKPSLSGHVLEHPHHEQGIALGMPVDHVRELGGSASRQGKVHPQMVSDSRFAERWQWNNGTALPVLGIAMRAASG